MGGRRLVHMEQSQRSVGVDTPVMDPGPDSDGADNACLDVIACALPAGCCSVRDLTKGRSTTGYIFAHGGDRHRVARVHNFPFGQLESLA